MGPAWTAQELLVRYNLELARGVLYWASQVQIEVHGGYKDLWKYLKLFKLMFSALPIEPADARRSRESSVAGSHFEVRASAGENSRISQRREESTTWYRSQK